MSCRRRTAECLHYRESIEMPAKERGWAANARGKETKRLVYRHQDRPAGSLGKGLGEVPNIIHGAGQSIFDARYRRQRIHTGHRSVGKNRTIIG
jgi:hypothetical protein